MKNNIGKTIKTASIIILIVGMIATGISFFAEFQASNTFNAPLLILSIIGIFIGSLITYGFGDIVDVVNRIYIKLDDDCED